MPLKVDVNYNWEGGRWHPFVGTGVGLYFMQFRFNDEAIGGTETRFGLNTGGGIDSSSIEAWRSKGKDAITPSPTRAAWILPASR